MNDIALQIENAGRAVALDESLLQALVREEEEAQVLTNEALGTGLSEDGVKFLFSVREQDRFRFPELLRSSLSCCKDMTPDCLSFALDRLKQAVRHVALQRQLRLLQGQRVTVVNQHGQVFSGILELNFNGPAAYHCAGHETVFNIILKQRLWNKRRWDFEQVSQIRGCGIIVSEYL